MGYVDGFVVAVPKHNIEAYKELARTAGEIWKEHGALAFVECIGDDVPTATSRPSHVPCRPRTMRSSFSPGSSTRRARSATRSMPK
jgi:hypothetical protein